MKNRFNNPKPSGVRYSLPLDPLEEIPPNKLFSLAYKAYKENAYEVSLRFISIAEKRRRKLSPEVSRKLDYLKGEVLLDMKRFKEAVKCYSQILKKEKTGVAFCNKALSLWELKRFGLALNNYLKAIKLNPKDEIIHRGAGEMYLKLNKPKLAVSHFQKAIKLKPDYGDAITGLGVALLKLKKWVKSYRSFKRAIKIDPTDELAEYWIRAFEKHLEL